MNTLSTGGSHFSVRVKYFTLVRHFVLKQFQHGCEHVIPNVLMAMGLSEGIVCLFLALTGAPWRQCVGEISTPYTIATHAASHSLRTVILNTDLYCKHGGDGGAFSPCVAVDLGQIIKCASKNCAVQWHATVL